MKTGIVIQARMNSQRLPGKMLLPLGDKTVLGQLVRRLQEISNARVIVATSAAKENDVLAKLCQESGYAFMRGDEEDVLKRYADAADQFKLDTIVRVTGDSPLIDPGIVRTMIDNFERLKVDYYSNLRPRSLPRGFGCEIFKASFLKAALADRQPGDRGEFVVIPYLERHLSGLKISNFKVDQDYSSVRLTLDETADYEVIRKIYEALPGEKNFSYQNVVLFLEQHPEIKKLNAHVQPKAV